MTPRKTLDTNASARELPKKPDVPNYNDEMSDSLVEALRERFGSRLQNAKPVSEAAIMAFQSHMGWRERELSLNE